MAPNGRISTADTPDFKRSKNPSPKGKMALSDIVPPIRRESRPGPDTSLLTIEMLMQMLREKDAEIARLNMVHLYMIDNGLSALRKMAPEAPREFVAKVGQDGRIVIPQALRDVAGIQEGDTISLHLGQNYTKRDSASGKEVLLNEPAGKVEGLTVMGKAVEKYRQSLVDQGLQPEEVERRTKAYEAGLSAGLKDAAGKK